MMNKTEFNIDVPFSLTFEAFDKEHRSIKGTRTTFNYEISKLFIQKAAYEFYDTSVLIYQDRKVQVKSVEHVGLEWDDLNDIETEYNVSILNHYESSNNPLLNGVLKWLKNNLSNRWVIYGEFNSVNDIKQISLNNYIDNLPERMKGWVD